ncbi:type VI secretion system lipoprotein TssJ [Pseudomonas plecoglossicida]|uniref:type VI secretion system lipoprotein TssJ n=1 Tax=Pseudomonas plecoglossicida TaxID=70775 RepID=UPI003D25E8EE
MKPAIVLMLAVHLLAGCSTVGNVFKKTAQIMMDPTIAVGNPQDQPTQIALSLYASADVNPNPVSIPAVAPPEDSTPMERDTAETDAHVHLGVGQYNRAASIAPTPNARRTAVTATPIVFRVLQLKDDSMLENAPPELLQDNPEKALGSTLVAMDDYALVPGQFKFIEFASIEEKSRYIAVVAQFHDPSAERWYDVFRVEPRGRKYPLMVMLQTTRVAITDERFRPAQDDLCLPPPASTYR